MIKQRDVIKIMLWVRPSTQNMLRCLRCIGLPRSHARRLQYNFHTDFIIIIHTHTHTRTNLLFFCCGRRSNNHAIPPVRHRGRRRRHRRGPAKRIFIDERILLLFVRRRFCTGCTTN